MNAAWKQVSPGVWSLAGDCVVYLEVHKIAEGQFELRNEVGEPQSYFSTLEGAQNIGVKALRADYHHLKSLFEVES